MDEIGYLLTRMMSGVQVNKLNSIFEG